MKNLCGTMAPSWHYDSATHSHVSSHYAHPLFAPFLPIVQHACGRLCPKHLCSLTRGKLKARTSQESVHCLTRTNCSPLYARSL